MQERGPFSRGLTLGLILMASAPQLARGADNEYKSAFGSEFTDKPEQAEEVAPAAAQPYDSLRDVGSFPVRIRHGDKDGLEWTDRDRRSYTAPKPAVRKFRVGQCEFSVATGDLSLTRYEIREDTHEVAVDTDPVLRFSTLDVPPTQGLLVSVSAELFVAMAPGKEQACRDKFAGRKIAFGQADMGPTELKFERHVAGGETEAFKAEPYRPQDETPIYIVWNDVANRLELVSKGGLPPAVGSPVFLVKPKSEGDYYLTVSPKLGIERTKKR